MKKKKKKQKLYRVTIDYVENHDDEVFATSKKKALQKVKKAAYIDGVIIGEQVELIK